jgi:hypothetical protein
LNRCPPPPPAPPKYDARLTPLPRAALRHTASFAQTCCRMQSDRIALPCIYEGCCLSALAIEGRNEWRLHPSLPVDVRLLGGGIVALGALYYFSVPKAAAPASTGKSRDAPAVQGGRPLPLCPY